MPSLQQVVVACLAGSAAAMALYAYKQRKSKQLVLDNRHVVMITTYDRCELWCKRFAQERLIGLDCEWVNDGEQVALLQISSESLVVLIRTCVIPQLPPSLVSLLADPAVLKGGVGIAGDALRIERMYGVLVSGCVDLRTLGIACGAVTGGGGLKDLASAILNLEIAKHSRVRCSNWEANTLSKEQITYAALDAIISQRVFAALVGSRIESSTELRVWCDSALMDNVRTPVRQPKPPRGGGGQDTQVQYWDMAAGPADDNETASQQQQQQQMSGRRRKVVKVTTIQAPLYHNCHILAPDGTMLCACSRKKVQWYLERDIATVVSEHPLTIRLKFEPAGRGHAGDEYYLSQKDNRCVVCGEDARLMRFHVVPLLYRRNFPERLKSHASHDVLLLCVRCHGLASMAAQREHRIIARELGLPMMDLSTTVKQTIDPKLIAAGKAARALRKERTVMPPERTAELREAVAEYLREHNGIISDDLPQFHKRRTQRGESPALTAQIAPDRLSENVDTLSIDSPAAAEDASTVSAEDASHVAAHGISASVVAVKQARPSKKARQAARKLARLAAHSPSAATADGEDDSETELDAAIDHLCTVNVSQPGPVVIESHGKAVVRQLGASGLGAFVRRWRQFFMVTMKPRFLPDGWSVDHFDMRPEAHPEIHSTTGQMSRLQTVENELLRNQEEARVAAIVLSAMQPRVVLDNEPAEAE